MSCPTVPWRRAVSHLAATLLALAPLTAAAQPQRHDEEYTKKIRELLTDPRITSELVDHLPASDKVPTPLKFHGRIIGQPGEITYAKDIQRYFEALDAASDRVKVWKIGQTEEGRDMIVLAVADEATIRDLDRYKGYLKELTDPRRTSEARAQELLKTAKPIYWITSGMHSPELGGPEMLQELAYRLAVEETPFIQNIRNGILTFITPVIEVDGREKQVDTYYFNKTLPTGQTRLPLMYWGKYVAHDNNRDGMGQFLALTKAVTRFQLEWAPQIMHDLHEAATYLYSSTGTGPYNEAIDPITVGEWWQFAEHDVVELTKRGIPGVWTYGFYDGWVPNYMFFIAHSHNATGRFYEVQSYGPDNYTATAGATTTSREWFRPNPPLPAIAWGPRANTNIQQTGILVSLQHLAKNRETYLENYWLKNKRSVEKGRTGPTFAWVIPRQQWRKGEVADAVNELRRQGLEIHTASAPFTVGTLAVQPGDYIVRADQPFRTLADMYFSLQSYGERQPSPYDDTGWTFQLMRHVTIRPVADKSVLTQPMAPLTRDAIAPGTIAGTGPHLIIEHTSDNTLTAMRFALADVKMMAAEADFDLDGRKIRRGAFIIANAPRAKVDAVLAKHGIGAIATATLPTVATHDLDLPRIGYIHSWARTQDEGWVRAALDTYGVPYTYFADTRVREGNLRARFDVIIYPHVGGTSEAQVNGIPKTAAPPLPYKKTARFQAIGAVDSADDIRGGLGLDGLQELYKFVQAGGTLITEGSTSTIFPDYKLVSGVTVEEPQGLFVRGSIVRGVISEPTSPIVYGYEGTQLPTYFSTAPVLSTGGLGALAAFGGRGSPTSQMITPSAVPVPLSPWDKEQPIAAPVAPPQPLPETPIPTSTPGSVVRGGGPGGVGTAATSPSTRPRAIVSFPQAPNEILLSGSLVNGAAIAGRAQVVDAPLGKGHVVMFAIRPFWRWQTQGTFTLGFNTILHWNDLDAGRAPGSTTGTPATGTNGRGEMR